MKILDSSAIICILDELGRPDLMDKVLELGHDLAVPRYIVESELRGRVKRKIKEMAKVGKVVILENTAEDLKFSDRLPKLGPGERNVLLSYRKAIGEGRRAYCILD